MDSLSLLKEINKQGAKNNRVIDCLLQVHIAKEETKFGLDEQELQELITTTKNEFAELHNVRVAGMMGMASFSENPDLIRKEFRHLKSLYDNIAQAPAGSGGPTSNLQLQTLSMGMSADYPIALEEGSNLVRIGSLIFGERN